MLLGILRRLDINFKFNATEDYRMFSSYHIFGKNEMFIHKRCQYFCLLIINNFYQLTVNKLPESSSFRDFRNEHANERGPRYPPAPIKYCPSVHPRLWSISLQILIFSPSVLCSVRAYIKKLKSITVESNLYNVLEVVSDALTI